MKSVGVDILEVVESKVGLSSEHLETHFAEMANKLFSHYQMIVNEIVFDLCELEFYFHSKMHPDPYVHMDRMQKINGQWYFHGSGIDITIGDGINYGGILIRGIYNTNADKYCSGPLNVAKELFNRIGSVGINNLQFGLRKRESARVLEGDFVAVPRINLPVKNGENEFALKKYRYLTRIEPRHHFKEKEVVAKALQLLGVSEDMINGRMFGYKIIK